MKSILIALLFISPLLTIAQNVGINQDGSTPFSGAILDIKSDDKGILIPRLETTAVASPTEGMLVYQPSDQSFYFYKSFAWQKIYAGTSSEGPSFETTASDLIRSTGTVDNENFIIGRSDIPAYVNISDKLFFYEQNSGAFRGGEIENSQVWSPINLGSNSFAYGKNVKANAPNSVAFGQDIDINSNSTAFAIGYQDTVMANLGSGALGKGNIVKGTSGNIALGENNFINTNSSNGAIAIGHGSSVLGSKSGIALGVGITTTTDSVVIIGRNNSNLGYPSDLAFAVGNGKKEYDDSAPHQDGLVIRTNGYTGINNNLPSDVFHVRNTAQKPNEGIVLSGDTLNNHVHLFLHNRNVGGKQYGLLSTGGNSDFGQGKFILRDVINSRQMMTFDSLGNLGIRTTAPADDFHLNIFPNNELGGITVKGGTNIKESHLILDAESNDGRAYLLASTGLGATTGEDKFIIRDVNAGMERLVINSSGNLGIGMDDPTYRLELKTKEVLNDGISVSGHTLTNHVQLRLENNASDGHHFNLFSTGGTSGFGDGKFIIRDATETTNRLVIDSDGNLGLGLDDPSFKVEIKTNETTNDGLLISGDPLTENVHIGLHNNGNDGHHYNLLSTGNASGFGDGKFIIRDISEAKDRLILDPSGNIGIGKIDPAARLEVQTNAISHDGIAISGNQNTRNVQLRLENNGIDGRYYNLFSTGGNSGFGDGKFIIKDITGDENRLILDSLGNMGIGELYPEAKLEIKTNAINSDGIVVSGNQNTKNVQIRLENNGTDGRHYNLFSTGGNSGFGDGKFIIRDAKESKNRLVLDSIGNIGIGEISPDEKLHVNGAIIIDTAFTNTSGTIQFKNDEFRGYNGTEWVAFGPEITAAIYDEDGDTGIDVEETSDEDILRIKLANDSRFLFNKTNGKSAHMDFIDVGNNIILGNKADQNTANSDNVFIGEDVALNTVDGNKNVFIGASTGQDLGSSQNVGIGFEALNSATSTTNGHVAIGTRAAKSMNSNIPFLSTTAIGYRAAENATAAGIFIGAFSGSYVTGGSNIMIGYLSGENITTGARNTMIGNGIGSNADGATTDVVIIGEGAGKAAGSYSTIIGTNAGSSILGFGTNTLIGYKSGQLITESGNTMVGKTSGTNTTTGNSNTLVGEDAGLINTIGNNNTFIGFNSGNQILEGHQNTALGTRSGLNFTDGVGCTVLGYQSGGTSGTSYDNALAVGSFSRLRGDNTGTIGDLFMTDIGGYASWSNLSDGRFKENVKTDVPGLDFISKLRPVTYNLKTQALAEFNNLSQETMDNQGVKKGMTKKSQEIQTGFIAQEVEAAAQASGYNFSGVLLPKNDQDTYRLRYAEFVVPLVKAVQEQQEQIEEQKQLLEAQQIQINALIKLVEQEK